MFFTSTQRSSLLRTSDYNSIVFLHLVSQNNLLNTSIKQENETEAGKKVISLFPGTESDTSSSTEASPKYDFSTPSGTFRNLKKFFNRPARSPTHYPSLNFDDDDDLFRARNDTVLNNVHDACAQTAYI